MRRTATVAGVEVPLGHFVAGEWRESEATFTDTSPVDGAVLAEMPRGSVGDAADAVSAAVDAFEVWSSTDPARRAQILHAIADGVEARREDLAIVETLDNGALLRSHLTSVVPRVAHNFRFFADQLLALVHDDFDTRGHRNHVSWEPAGVAVAITPWNAPLMLSTWKVAPALAAGNTVVLKPAEWSPLTASLLAEIAAEAGVGAGTFNVLQGVGEEAGAALVRDPRVARVSFTGSVETGRSVAAAAGQNLTPVSLELGGKSPFIVFDDADLDLALSKAAGQYDNAGQVCLAGTRMLVHDVVFEHFVEQLGERARALIVGDPRQPDTDVGPLIAPAHLERVEGFVARAASDGLHPVLGGKRHPRGGLYYEPTLYADVPPSSELATSEVFGPVLTVSRFADEEEAVMLANATEYGLAAMVFTGDHRRAERVARRLVAGTVWINCFFVRDLRAPFGGARHSGVGREGGNWSFDFYSELKDTVFSPAGWRP